MKDTELIEQLRIMASTYGCRLEICSHYEKMPVSASNADGSAYGFGKTVEEAVAKLNERIARKAKESARPEPARA